jgi:hypothetical protein
MSKKWFPVTPAGTVVTWLPGDTADEAWAKLLDDASHMPYKGRDGFAKRGYRVLEYPASMATAPAKSYKFSTGPK